MNGERNDKSKEAPREPSPEDVFNDEAVFSIEPLQLASPLHVIARTESTESQPGAFAILGPDCPELRRQDRLSTPISTSTQQESLIHAVIVEEDAEQPSLVFEALPLVKPGTWKWITAVSLLVLLLTFTVAIVFIQASKTEGVSGNPSDSDEPRESTGLNIAFTDAPSDSPSSKGVGPIIGPSAAPTLSTERPSGEPSFGRVNEPTETDISLVPSSATKAPVHQETETALPNAIPSSAPSPYITPWEQVGQRIVGESGGNALGQSVALSRDGDFMAVGSHLYDFATELDTGRVRVYYLESNDKWQQIGQDIVGSAAGDQAGWAIDLSADGTILAVGALTGGNNLEGSVRVYEYDRGINAWKPLGQALLGENDAVFFGVSLSLSGDGMTLVVGADRDDGGGTDAGKVQTFYYNRLLGRWLQFGQTFQGSEDGDQAGSAVSLSGNGQVVAMGMRNRDTSNGSNVGLVRVYKPKEISLGWTWTPLGSSISGTESEIGFGFSVDLSSDGMTLAASSRVGFHIFNFDSDLNDWVETESIFFIESGNIFESSEVYIDLSPDGRSIVVSKTDDVSPGSIQVYGLDDQTGHWVPIGRDIKVDAMNASFVSSTSLSDSHQLAVGFPEYASGGGLNVGSVVVYQLQAN